MQVPIFEQIYWFMPWVQDIVIWMIEVMLAAKR